MGWRNISGPGLPRKSGCYRMVNTDKNHLLQRDRYGRFAAPVIKDYLELIADK